MMRQTRRQQIGARRPRVSEPSVRLRVGLLVLAYSLTAGSSLAVSTESFNGCQGTTDDPCVRSGSCEIQGAIWSQDVTIDRSDIFDTQGWSGVCDMVHVALVQGNCDPPGATMGVTAHLSPTTNAWIASIVGPLSCAGTPAPASLSFDDPESHGEVAVGFFSDVTYTVSNNGQSEATSVVFSGLAGDWSLGGGTCDTSIAAGSSCTVVARYAPSDVGPSEDTLLLDYHDGTGPAPTVPKAVSGAGIAISVSALYGPWRWIALIGLASAALTSVARPKGSA